MEEDIQNHSPIVMFRGTPCIICMLGLSMIFYSGFCPPHPTPPLANETAVNFDMKEIRFPFNGPFILKLKMLSSLDIEIKH